MIGYRELLPGDTNGQEQLAQAELDNLARMKELLLPGGFIIISGILEEDEEQIVVLAKELSLYVDNKIKEEKWISIRFSC